MLAYHGTVDHPESNLPELRNDERHPQGKRTPVVTH